MELLSISYLNSLRQFFFVVNGRAKFSVLLQRRFRWVFPSPFYLDVCTVNCTTEIEGIQWEKAALKSPRVQLNKLNLHSPLQLQNKKFDYKITFLAIYLLNRGKSSYINKSSIRVNDTIRKIIDYSRKKHCRDHPLFFQRCTCVFFSCALSDWQVSDCDRYL